jgi:hypothetical protein
MAVHAVGEDAGMGEGAATGTGRDEEAVRRFIDGSP